MVQDCQVSRLEIGNCHGLGVSGVTVRNLQVSWGHGIGNVTVYEGTFLKRFVTVLDFISNLVFWAP